MTKYSLPSIEQSFLCHVCIDDSLTAFVAGLKVLTPAHFTNDMARLCWEALTLLDEMPTAEAVAEQAIKLNECEGRSEILGYLAGDNLYSAWEENLADIHDLYQKRTLEKAAQDVLAMIPQMPAAHSLSHLDRAMGKAIAPHLMMEGASGQDILFVGERAFHPTRPISTGFGALDDAIDGFLPRELIVLASRPQEGKSALAHWVMRENSVAAGKKCLLFSNSLPTDEVARRLLLMQSDVPAPMIKHDTLYSDQQERYVAATQALARAPIYIEDNTHSYAEAVAITARQHARKTGLDYIIIDSLRGLSRLRDRPASKLDIADLVITDLKDLARELDVPVILLCTCEAYRSGKAKPRAPTLGSLLGTMTLAEDADKVLTLWRPDPSDATGYNLFMAKNNKGRSMFTLPLNFSPHSMRFELQQQPS